MTFLPLIYVVKHGGTEELEKMLSREELYIVWKECAKLLNKLEDFPPIYIVEDIRLLYKTAGYILKIGS